MLRSLKSFIAFLHGASNSCETLKTGMFYEPFLPEKGALEIRKPVVRRTKTSYFRISNRPFSYDDSKVVRFT